MRTATSSIAAADGVAFEDLDGATAIFVRIFHPPCFAARFSLWLGAQLRSEFLAETAAQHQKPWSITRESHFI